MGRRLITAILILITGLAGFAQGEASQALFVPNEGQWPGNFEYKLRLSNGSVFFTPSGYRCLLHQSSEENDHPHQFPGGNTTPQSLAYEMEWINANTASSNIAGGDEMPFRYNYFIGKDSSRWKANVGVHSGITYQNIYSNVDVEYRSQGPHLKYNIILKPGSDISDVQMKFNGVEKYFLREGQLIVETALGEIREWIPESYQIINGVKVSVDCQYRINGDSIGFELGTHNSGYEVVIDPILEFSTFTGSLSDNWGFTATYGNDGSFYGGGVTFSDQFPATTGVVQGNFSGKIDIAINKFSKDGGNLKYATYIGGSAVELPHSMIVDQQGNLYVLGNSGSTDFPTTSNAFRQNFTPGSSLYTQLDTLYFNGSNIIVFKLNSTGTSLLSSTFLGGSIGDGLNQKIALNYGDNSRGEVISLDNGNVAIASHSLSPDLPLNNVGADLSNGSQNALLAVFNPDLSNLIWGTYFGGSGNEAGYSVRTDGTHLFFSGSTSSSDLLTNSLAVQPSRAGGYDGFLAKFHAGTGQFIQATYVGTFPNDQCFFVEVDKHGFVYTYGQSQGNIPITPGRYNNNNSYQFVQKYSNDLTKLEWSTQVGSGGSKIDLVPTAFMVDKCLNIYLSGWGGNVNFNYLRGNTRNLPVTADAFQSTTDGSDFYFMALSRDAQSLLFGSYFGGTSREHVDGGTSRFSPKGVIYQAACAGCQGGGFPTTAASYSPTKPADSCNLGAIKIDFQQTVRSLPAVDFDVDVDTACSELHVQFTNNSLSANKYYWDFGNGHTSLQETPSTVFENFGTYTITLIAEDTICDISDTNTVVITHDKGVKPDASFEADYLGCDNSFEVKLSNTAETANEFLWMFGDGQTSTLENPVHYFPDSGSYTIRFIATDSVCNTIDTAEATVSFEDTTTVPRAMLVHPECGKGLLDVHLSEARNRYDYRWEYTGGVAEGQYPEIRFTRKGFYKVDLEIYDSICAKTYEYTYEISIDNLTQEIYIPNAFSPNADGINDHFMLTGDNCFDGSLLKIYNRWGALIFETERPFEEFWDGTYKGREVPSGVYTYILRSGDEMERGHLTLFR